MCISLNLFGFPHICSLNSFNNILSSKMSNREIYRHITDITIFSLNNDLHIIFSYKILG